jgi:Zn-finger nucleic acid-binding protein
MSDRTQCEFCRSRLKTVGCPACLGVMFLGSRFCTHCGAKATAAVVIENQDAGDCPRCKRPLQVLEIDNVTIRECNKCGGFWSDVDTFESICASQEQQAAVLGFIGSDAHPNDHPAAISYVPCPDCTQLMNRSNFARSSGVIIDICKEHGVWFDADELPKLIAFINTGGMTRQREKEKLSIEDERRKLRDDRRRMSSIERRAGVTKFDEPVNTPKLGRIIRILFDQ